MNYTKHSQKKRGTRDGFVLIALAVGVVAFIGSMGLAIDVGRMLIAKNEGQTFVDAASLAATLELDGTSDGIDRARVQANSARNLWNFNNNTFSDISISFAKEKNGPYDTEIIDPRGYRFARVQTRVSVPITFSTVQSSPPAANGAPLALLMGGYASVAADSIGGQEPRTIFKEGLFPFSPYAHNSTGPHFGLVPGQRYTLRWAATPRVNSNTCEGDNSQDMITIAEAGGGAERGFIESTSADLIRATIEQDYQTVTRVVGESVIMTGGAKQTQLDSLINRVRQDTDVTSQTYADYLNTHRGNGRRLVAAPINTGAPDYTIVQIGAFLLLPASEYDNGGNKPFCAEYVGAWVRGSRNHGVMDSGAFLPVLVR